MYKLTDRMLQALEKDLRNFTNYFKVEDVKLGNSKNLLQKPYEVILIKVIKLFGREMDTILVVIF